MNKNQKKTIKILIILFSMIIPMGMLFGFLIPSGKAAPSLIPEAPDDPRNEWTWGITEHQILNYTLEMKVTDNETQELEYAFRMLSVMNITSIKNNTIDLMGQQEVSQVNATMNYYDCVDNKLKTLDSESSQIAAFGFNTTDVITEKYITQEEGFFPIIFPLNSSIFNATAAALIMNSTFETYSEMGVVNNFDVCGWDFDQKRIWFQNTAFDYYFNATYDEYGVLEYGETKILVSMGDPESEDQRWKIMEYKLEKVPSYFLDEEIEWGVNIGDISYFGRSADDDNGGDGDFDEVEVIITGFNESMHGIDTMWGDEPMPMAFQNVLANVSLWNEETEKYEPFLVNWTIAFANDLYPIHPYSIDSIQRNIGLIPNNTKLEDLEFLGSSWESYGFDTNIHDEVIIELEHKEYGVEILMDFNNDTGILNLWKTVAGGETKLTFFKKNLDSFTDRIDRFELYSDVVSNNDVYLNMTASGVDLDLYWAVLPVNPIEPLDYTFYNAIPDFELFLDLYTNNSAAINDANVTIYYDFDLLNTLQIPETELIAYKFNVLGNNEWDEIDSYVNVVDHSINFTLPNADLGGLSLYAIGAEVTWNWSADIDKGSEMYYETTGTLGGIISEDIGDVNMPFVDFYILNVTDVGYSYKNRGDGVNCWMNQIESELLYWDPTAKGLDKFDDAGEFILSEFNYSTSHDPEFYLNLTEHSLGFPIAVPLRWGNLYLNTIGYALNESFYSSKMARDIGLPIWDEIKVNPITRTLTLNETSSNYYMALTYYNNGTLERAEGSLEFNLSGNMVEFNITTIRKSDYNQTDEVEWGVEVGDSYYFGSNFPMGGPTIEVNITIVDINETAVYLGDLMGKKDDEGGPPIFQSWITFSNVWGKIEVWNETGNNKGEWVELGVISEGANTTTIIAAANNYLPFPIGDYLEYFNLSGYFAPMILPKGIDAYELGETYKDLVSVLAVYMFDGDVIPVVTKNTTDLLRIDMISPLDSSFSGFIEWYLDAETGVCKYWYVTLSFGGETFIANIFKKNHTSVNNADETPKKITIVFDNYIAPDVNATLTVEYLGNFSFFEAVLYNNPVNNSMSSAYGNPMLFTDLFLINYTNAAYNLTFKFDLPARFPVEKIEYLAIYRYIDPSNPEAGIWEYEPLADITFGTFTRDVANNNMTLQIDNLNGTLVIIVAWMFMGPRRGFPVAVGDEDDDDEVAGIPGYDIYLLLLAMSLISIVIVLERRKRIKF